MQIARTEKRRIKFSRAGSPFSNWSRFEDLLSLRAPDFSTFRRCKMRKAKVSGATTHPILK